MRHRLRSAQSLVAILSCGLAACLDYQEAEGPGFGGAAGSPSVAGLQASLQQETPVTVDVSSDTSVRVSNPNLNFGTTPTIDINRGLVQVNQSALTSAVGPTDYVVSAVLRVSLVPDGARRVQRNLDVHRVLKSWTENQATWNCALDSNTGNRQPDCTGATAWKMTGIIDAYVTTATTRATIPATRTGTIDLDVTADVRAFLSGDASNFGWLLKTGQGNGSEVADLASRESSTPPKLVMNVRRPDPPALVVINETDSNSATSEPDFVELYNQGSSEADVSGWSIRDNDDTHVFVIPAGTKIPVGGYVTFSEQAGQLTFGLGAADSVRLFDAGTILKDTYTWSAHAATTYGRCPNGTGSFTTTTNSTKGAANDCGSGPTFAMWPGSQTIATADNAGTWASNLSGLTYQPATATTVATLWAVQNSPSKLFRLEKTGSVWVNSSAADWSAGKTLFYTNGSGMPDSEGVTKADWDSPFVYVATERDNGVNGTSRLSILRFDTNAAGASLMATHEWNLTATLPVVGANLGLEAITHVPDAYLVQAGLRDQSTNQLYDPNQYPDHGTGLFFVGVEGTGMIYGFALNHTDSTFTRIVSFSSGMPGVMGLEFDRDQDTLYAYCDNTCGNRATLFAVQTDAMSSTFGSFFLGAAYNRPTGLPADMNNESIAIAPEAECTAGQKAVFWSDDGATGGNSLRVGSINCGSLF